jgi:hypothetical protein
VRPAGECLQQFEHRGPWGDLVFGRHGRHAQAGRISWPPTTRERLRRSR